MATISRAVRFKEKQVSHNIPIEVYETIAEMNQKGLEEAINELNFDRMHQCFNRMTHALEQVEQYKREGKQ
jgi:hypothetical protein